MPKGRKRKFNMKVIEHMNDYETKKHLSQLSIIETLQKYKLAVLAVEIGLGIATSSTITQGSLSMNIAQLINENDCRFTNDTFYINMLLGLLTNNGKQFEHRCNARRDHILKQGSKYKHPTKLIFIPKLEELKQNEQDDEFEDDDIYATINNNNNNNKNKINKSNEQVKVRRTRLIRGSTDDTQEISPNSTPIRVYTTRKDELNKFEIEKFNFNQESKIDNNDNDNLTIQSNKRMRNLAKKQLTIPEKVINKNEFDKYVQRGFLNHEAAIYRTPARKQRSTIIRNDRREFKILKKGNLSKNKDELATVVANLKQQLDKNTEREIKLRQQEKQNQEKIQLLKSQLEQEKERKNESTSNFQTQINPHHTKNNQQTPQNPNPIKNNNNNIFRFKNTKKQQPSANQNQSKYDEFKYDNTHSKENQQSTFSFKQQPTFSFTQQPQTPQFNNQNNQQQNTIPQPTSNKQQQTSNSIREALIIEEDGGYSAYIKYQSNNNFEKQEFTRNKERMINVYNELNKLNIKINVFANNIGPNNNNQPIIDNNNNHIKQPPTTNKNFDLQNDLINKLKILHEEQSKTNTEYENNCKKLFIKVSNGNLEIAQNVIYEILSDIGETTGLGKDLKKILNEDFTSVTDDRFGNVYMNLTFHSTKLRRITERQLYQLKSYMNELEDWDIKLYKPKEMIKKERDYKRNQYQMSERLKKLEKQQKRDEPTNDLNDSEDEVIIINNPLSNNRKLYNKQLLNKQNNKQMTDSYIRDRNLRNDYFYKQANAQNTNKRFNPNQTNNNTNYYNNDRETYQDETNTISGIDSDQSSNQSFNFNFKRNNSRQSEGDTWNKGKSKFMNQRRNF